MHCCRQSVLVLLSILAARRHKETNRIHKGGNRTGSPLRLQSALSLLRHQKPRHPTSTSGLEEFSIRRPPRQPGKTTAIQFGPSISPKTFQLDYRFLSCQERRDAAHGRQTLLYPLDNILLVRACEL